MRDLEDLLSDENHPCYHGNLGYKETNDPLFCLTGPNLCWSTQVRTPFEGENNNNGKKKKEKEIFPPLTSPSNIVISDGSSDRNTPGSRTKRVLDDDLSSCLRNLLTFSCS